MGKSRKLAQRLKTARCGCGTPCSNRSPNRTRHCHEVVYAYLASCKSREIKGSTLAKYKTLTNQLGAYCRDKGYTPRAYQTPVSMARRSSMSPTFWITNWKPIQRI